MIFATHSFTDPSNAATDGLLSGNSASYEKKERAENAVAKIREKYGYATLQRGVVMEDEKLNGLDIRGRKDD